MKEVNSEKVSKRFLITHETFKLLKIKAIELDLDIDGKSTPEALGDVIFHLFKEIEMLKSNLKDVEKKEIIPGEEK